jgi:hypothetical protein
MRNSYRNYVRPVVMLMLLAGSSIASATLHIEPAQPALHETVHLADPTFTIPPFEYWGPGTRVSMTGNVITVTLVPNPFRPIPPPPRPALDVVLGKFPAGSYDVNLVYDDTSDGNGLRTVATLHFAVASVDATAAVTAPLFDYTDLWWTPAESGWGLSFVQHISQRAFAAWFVYGIDGKPTWYVMPGGSWTVFLNGSRFSGSVYKTTGPYFGAAFNPGNVSVLSAGTAVFEFSDFSHAHLSYTIDGVTVAKDIERELFVSSPPSEAQLTIQPQQPSPRDPVHLKVANLVPGSVDARFTLQSMVGNVITVTLQMPGVVFEGLPNSADVVLGEFPPGAYDVNVISNATGHPAPIGTAHFTVGNSGIPFNYSGFNYSDLWWSPTESGWGLTISQQSNGTFFAVWFVYGTDGKPIWYVTPGDWIGADLVSGTVYRTTGPYFGGAFNPANVAVTPAGTATFQFTDFSHASFTYTVDGVTATKAIERQPF